MLRTSDRLASIGILLCHAPIQVRSTTTQPEPSKRPLMARRRRQQRPHWSGTREQEEGAEETGGAAAAPAGVSLGNPASLQMRLARYALPCCGALPSSSLRLSCLLVCISHHLHLDFQNTIGDVVPRVRRAGAHWCQERGGCKQLVSASSGI